MKFLIQVSFKTRNIFTKPKYWQCYTSHITWNTILEYSKLIGIQNQWVNHYLLFKEIPLEKIKQITLYLVRLVKRNINSLNAKVAMI